MPDITGSIRTKKLGETGITEDTLAADWKHPGQFRMAVVELRVEMPHGPDAEGNRKVDYVISMLEPVPEDQDERVRSYLRTLYRMRPEQQGQAVLTGTAGEDEQGVEDALATMTAGLPDEADLPDEPVSVEGDCPSEGCTLPAYHDGDHRIPDPDAHPDV